MSSTSEKVCSDARGRNDTSTVFLDPARPLLGDRNHSGRGDRYRSGDQPVATQAVHRQHDTASTSLVIDSKSSDPLLGAMMTAQVVPGYLATQVDIIGSTRVAQRVVALTQLDQVPLLQEQWREATQGQGSMQVWLAEILRKGLEVRPSRGEAVTGEQRRLDQLYR